MNILNLSESVKAQTPNWRAWATEDPQLCITDTQTRLSHQVRVQWHPSECDEGRWERDAVLSSLDYLLRCWIRDDTDHAEETLLGMDLTDRWERRILGGLSRRTLCIRAADIEVTHSFDLRTGRVERQPLGIWRPDCA